MRRVSASLRAPGEPGPHGGLYNPGKAAPANPPGFLSSVRMDSESSHTASLICLASPPQPLPPDIPCDAGTVSTSWMKTQARDRPHVSPPTLASAMLPGTAKPRGADRRPSPSLGRESHHAASCPASARFHRPSPRIRQGLGVRIQGQQEPEEPRTSPRVPGLPSPRQEQE